MCGTTLPVLRSDIDLDGVSRSTRRPPSCIDALGLALHFLNSTMTEITLQEIFVLTPTVCSRYLVVGIKILLQTLRRTPRETIARPKKRAEIQYFAKMIFVGHPFIAGGFYLVDGLKIFVAESLDEDAQSSHYKGWTCSRYCASVSAFAPDGTIIWASLKGAGMVLLPLYALQQNTVHNTRWFFRYCEFCVSEDSSTIK